MFVKNPLYISQLEYASSLDIDWAHFSDTSFLITGASGLIGTFLIDMLIHASKKFDLNIEIVAVSRNLENAKNRFGSYWDKNGFTYISQDVNKTLPNDIGCDFIIHGASNTHPLAYSEDPVGTITANILGTKNLLDFASKKENTRVAFLSSVEIYGEDRWDTKKFTEDYCGYIDCNTLRAGYPESKRTGESLCQAYIHAKGLDVVIPRLSRVYGPTMSQGDSKAIAQFIKKAVNKENIVLKSEGNQFYSYTYVADAAVALIYILLYGKCGEAYNVSDENSEITLKTLAETLADITDTKVVYELPERAEALGYSKAVKAVLDNKKLKKLGWSGKYDIKSGLEQTLNILTYRGTIIC